MALTRDQMKEALRANALGVTSMAEYDAELREYLLAREPSGGDLARMTLEVIGESRPPC